MTTKQGARLSKYSLRKLQPRVRLSMRGALVPELRSKEASEKNVALFLLLEEGLVVGLVLRDVQSSGRAIVYFTE